MKQFKWSSIALVMALLIALPAMADQIPRSLRGKIITSQTDIDIPNTNLVKRLSRQDRKVIPRSEGRWTVYLVAFFNKPLPTDQMGLVVLNAKKEPVAVAQIGGSKGQRTLATHIDIDSTEAPGTQHTIMVYYARGGKPVSLAEKSIVLK